MFEDEQYRRRRHVPVVAENLPLVTQRPSLKLEGRFDGIKHFCTARMTNELRRLQTRRLDEAPNGRRHSLFDKSRQGAREHDPKTHGIDYPAHNIERARPGMFGDCPDTRTPLFRLSPQNYRRRSIAEQRRRNHVGLCHAVGARNQCAKLYDDHQHDLAGLGTCQAHAKSKTGNAAGATSPKDRHAHHRWPQTQLGTNTRFKSRRGDAGRGYCHDDVDVARSDPCTVECSLCGLNEERAGALDVGIGALAPVVWLAQPLQRPHRIPPLDARIGEHLGKLREAREGVGINLTRGISDRALIKLMRRNGGGDRKHVNGRSHPPVSFGRASPQTGRTPQTASASRQARARSPRLLSRSTARSGIVMLKVAPIVPGTSRISPPCARTSSAAIARPRPVPPARAEPWNAWNK